MGPILLPSIADEVGPAWAAMQELVYGLCLTMRAYCCIIMNATSS